MNNISRQKLAVQLEKASQEAEEARRALEIHEDLNVRINASEKIRTHCEVSIGKLERERIELLNTGDAQKLKSIEIELEAERLSHKEMSLMYESSKKQLKEHESVYGTYYDQEWTHSKAKASEKEVKAAIKKEIEKEYSKEYAEELEKEMNEADLLAEPEAKKRVLSSKAQELLEEMRRRDEREREQDKERGY